MAAFRWTDRDIRQAFLGLAFIFAVLAKPATANDNGLVDTVAEVKKGVVGVGTFQGIRQPQSLLMGSGFAIGSGLHVLTNYHVVADHLQPVNKEYLVVLVGRGQQFEPREAEVVADDPVHDLALLKITGEPLPALDLGSRQIMAREGQGVALTGYPIGPVYGLYSVTHRGIIAAITPNVIPQAQARLLDPTVIRQRRYDVYQLDITAYPGNSGSPLYDQSTGRVVGILNSAFVKGTKETALTDPSGISFAIPIKYAFPMLDRAEVLKR